MTDSILDNELLIQLTAEENSKDEKFKNDVIRDLWICLVSREVSLQGRKDVLLGRGKFGIFGAGKELPQVALAKYFRKGDYRAGYYRDQTLLFALGESDVQSFLAQLYSDPINDPFSGGRQMNTHFASPFLDEDGSWTDQTSRYNISSDTSATAGQMGRALGLAMASDKYRKIENLDDLKKKFGTGDEVCISTIGDASTSEGAFWEVMNAACVHKVPLVMIVWDDGYGISVPVEFQTAKASISRAMEGFLRDEDGNGMDMYTAKAWDYTQLCVTFDKAISKSRKEHMPCLIHVQECTQPQGHSTSGSHERYKTEERLKFENEADCIKRFSDWIIENEFISENEYLDLRAEAKAYAKACRSEAWKNSKAPFIEIRSSLEELMNRAIENHPSYSELHTLYNRYKKEADITRREILILARRAAYLLPNENDGFRDIINQVSGEMKHFYGTHLFAQGPHSALNIPITSPKYDDDSQDVNGYQIMNKFFDVIFEKHSNVLAFGEDVGFIGDVNQGLSGLQDKYGADRIYDSGIREWSIVGQAIGMALRGLRPIAEIQYLDYIYYGLTPLTDDLATLRYRSNNLQAAPVIIRTRGHRLEGIWHTGSPMGTLLNSLKGIYLCVPRNFVQAAGMYNTMLSSMDPAIVVEPLNAYRNKEKLPANLGDYTIPLGVPEVLSTGDDITLVTYGSCIRVAEKALELAELQDISVELIDVQTLMPFDLEGVIVNSLKKTNRIVFMDEDVPGGGTAYMLQKVIEDWNGYQYLDMPPRTVSSKEHRSPYGSDGDYYTKPQAEDVFEVIYAMVYEEPII
jgi:pyruvate/2-oxoglutarate/acetoin dehydrogenase E1 component/TPP-dependent pyruvate/acetoin dehydrogenase alpha subunit